MGGQVSEPKAVTETPQIKPLEEINFAVSKSDRHTTPLSVSSTIQANFVLSATQKPQVPVSESLCELKTHTL